MEVVDELGEPEEEKQKKIISYKDAPSDIKSEQQFDLPTK